jgi:hypothetical protein
LITKNLLVKGEHLYVCFRKRDNERNAYFSGEKKNREKKMSLLKALFKKWFHLANSESIFCPKYATRHSYIAYRMFLYIHICSTANAHYYMQNTFSSLFPPFELTACICSDRQRRLRGVGLVVAAD